MCRPETEFTLSQNEQDARRPAPPALSRSSCGPTPSVAASASPCLHWQFSSWRSLLRSSSSLSSKNIDTDHAQNLFSMAHSSISVARWWQVLLRREYVLLFFRKLGKTVTHVIESPSFVQDRNRRHRAHGFPENMRRENFGQPDLVQGNLKEAFGGYFGVELFS
jgi:hypothetical protein